MEASRGGMEGSRKYEDPSANIMSFLATQRVPGRKVTPLGPSICLLEEMEPGETRDLIIEKNTTTKNTY